MKFFLGVLLGIGALIVSIVLAIVVPKKYPVSQRFEKKGEVAADPDRDIALVAVMTVKQSQRNPDSFALEDAFITSSAVCLTYRGQNGFGGMSRGQAVVARDFKFAFADHESGFVRAWNKGCAKQPAKDMTESMKLNLRYNPAMK